MRNIRAVVPVSVLLLIGFSASVYAQTDPCHQVGVPVSMLGLMSPRVAFTGVVKTSFEQRLYDGNTIRSVSASNEARDSTGRTRTEFRGGCMPGDDGQMHPTVSVSVHDPVARTTTSWQENSSVLPKVARVFHQQQLIAQPAPVQTPEEQEQKKQLAEKMRLLNQARRDQRPLVTSEDLGTKQLNGMTAKGVRRTETIPSGAQGNDLPLIVVNETWTAVNSRGFILMRISDDPRRGRTVSEFQDLKLGEPDPSQFAPPVDYKIQDVTSNTAIIAGIAALATP